MPKTEIQTITAKSIRTTEDALILVLESGDVSVPWGQCSPRLAAAKADERRHAELSPSGYGIHWPLIDEDLTVAGLVQRAEDQPK